MYKPSIGLEVHAELNTQSKMFCSCKNDPDEKRPNFNICEICTGQPGSLPVANEEAIKKVIKTGLALNCKIAEQSKFDRKNYFYPDLPKGYQISQYDQPIASNGSLQIKDQNAKIKNIRIRRIHLEEDTGSLLHPEGADYSLVNLNRSGVPLMELVTEPDIASGEEARKFAEELQCIFRYLGVSDADMEKGLVRVEVNISLSKTTRPGLVGEIGELGTKVEIKNLNSFKVVEKAIDFEIERQKKLLGDGEKVVQETRGWRDKKDLPAEAPARASHAGGSAQAGITFSQREKEEAHDYRYFPEPDLPPLYFEKEYIEKIEAEIPELPEQKRNRFIKEYGLDEKSVEVFINNKDFSEYFEKVASEIDEWIDQKNNSELKKAIKLASNYLISDVLGILNGKEFIEKEFKITSENFAEFIKMIHRGEISSKVAKMVLVEMINTGVDPSAIVDENNWRQMEDDGELEKVIKDIISKNAKAVEDYKKGNKNVLQFLAGQVMAVTRGTANPAKARQLLEDLLQ
ncbi:MAG: Asp-tRNA(Asn)/Glu-tRNA(Gln) amidotransferase subunit GatB [Patescibacteria group bacterium]